MRRQKDVPSFLEPETGVDVGSLYLGKVRVQHLRHRGPRHIGPLLRHARGVEVSPRVLRVAHVHIRDDVHYPAVGLLREALVKAPVPGLHVEDGDVEPLRPYNAQAGVRVPEHQHGVRLRLHHQLVARIDDVAHRRPEVIAHCVKVYIGVLQLQVPEEHPVEVVVVVLAGVCQKAVEVLPALVDHCRKPDDLRARAHRDQKLQPAVSGKSDV